MKELKFDHNVEEYCVASVDDADRKVILRFNPTDSEFIYKLYNAFDRLDKKQEQYNSEVKKCADKAEIFRIAKVRDAEMREIIDGIFEEPVCDQIFGKHSLYMIANGFHAWANFLLALMDETDDTFSREQKATNPRLKKYTERYHK